MTTDNTKWEGDVINTVDLLDDCVTDLREMIEEITLLQENLEEYLNTLNKLIMEKHPELSL
jgi:hypothetical protein